MASYPLLSLTPTPVEVEVEVELGCDNIKTRGASPPPDFGWTTRGIFKHCLQFAQIDGGPRTVSTGSEDPHWLEQNIKSSKTLIMRKHCLISFRPKMY